MNFFSLLFYDKMFALTSGIVEQVEKYKSKPILTKQDNNKTLDLSFKYIGNFIRSWFGWHDAIKKNRESTLNFHDDNDEW